jgi:hypothetical protein
VKTPNHENPDFRDLFPLPPSPEIEAACLYEYMRESQRLRDELNGRGKSDQGLQCPFFPNLMLARVSLNVRRLGRSTLQSPFLPNSTLSELGVLLVALRRAGFPRPWKRLNDASKTHLVSLLAGITKERLRGDKKTYPPVIIEEGAAEFDPVENCWRVGQLEPSELSLFKITLPDRESTERWEHSSRRFFFGFIRIDRGCNETEAVEAFREEFRKRWGKTKGGGSPKWQAKLNDLVVMRLSKRFPRREDAIKRVEHVANYTTAGFAGCKAFMDDRQKARREKREVEQCMSKEAIEEMSRACGDALKFFQTFFPGEIPLSCPRRTLAATRKQMKTS